MSPRSVLRLIVAATFAAALFVPSTAAAQGAVGAKVGLNVSKVSFTPATGDEDATSIDSLSGFLAGVTFRKDFTPIVGLQVEGVYAQSGSKLNFSDGIDTFTAEVGLDYFQVPVLVTFAAMHNDSSSVRLFVGPTFGFKVSDSFKQFVNGTEFPLSPGDEPEFNSVDTGITFGGLVGIKQFFIDARYTVGLTNLLKDSSDPDDESAKNRQFAIAFGFYFKGR
jgi:hypothetical protein